MRHTSTCSQHAAQGEPHSTGTATFTSGVFVCLLASAAKLRTRVWSTGAWARGKRWTQPDNSSNRCCCKPCRSRLLQLACALEPVPLPAVFSPQLEQREQRALLYPGQPCRWAWRDGAPPGNARCHSVSKLWTMPAGSRCAGRCHCRCPTLLDNGVHGSGQLGVASSQPIVAWCMLRAFCCLLQHSHLQLPRLVGC